MRLCREINFSTHPISFLYIDIWLIFNTNVENVEMYGKIKSKSKQKAAVFV